jgi:hypothetical protein
MRGTVDFFECLKMATLIKLQFEEKHSGMYDFLHPKVNGWDDDLLKKSRKQ